MNRAIYLFKSSKHTYFACDPPAGQFKIIKRYKVRNSRAVEYQINPLTPPEQIEAHMRIREIKFEPEEPEMTKQIGEVWDKSKFDKYVLMQNSEYMITDSIRNSEVAYFEKMEDLMKPTFAPRRSMTDIFELQKFIAGPCWICYEAKVKEIPSGSYLLIHELCHLPICRSCVLKHHVRPNPGLFKKLFPIFRDRTTAFAVEHIGIPESIYDLPAYIVSYVQLDESLFAGDGDDYSDLVHKYFLSNMPSWDPRLIFLNLFFEMYDKNQSYITFNELKSFIKNQKYKIPLQMFIDCIADADITKIEGFEIFKLFGFATFRKEQYLIIHKLIEIQRDIFAHFEKPPVELDKKEAHFIESALKNYRIVDRKLVKLEPGESGDQEDAAARGSVKKVKVKFDLSKVIKYDRMVLQGIAGSGKTTISQILLNEFKNLGYRVIVLGPTGKSIDVVIKKYKIDAEYSTIHRFLLKSGVNPEEKTFILIDEASMIDSFLMRLLYNRIDKENTRIVLAGDYQQARPVRFGDDFSRFRDLKNTQRLEIQYRQTGILYQMLFEKLLGKTKPSVYRLVNSLAKSVESKSGSGSEPEEKFTVKQKTKGRYLEIAETRSVNLLVYREFETLAEVAEQLRKQIPDFGSQDEPGAVKTAYDEHQVITYRNETRTKLVDYLNQEYTVRALSEFKKLPNRRFKTGDKIIFTRNKYLDELRFEYFNGMMATYVDHNSTHVTTTEKTVGYEHMLPITIADALTIHKMQGSGASNIYLILNESTIDYRILYTAMSRTYGKLFIYAVRNRGNQKIEDTLINYEDTSKSYLDFVTGPNAGADPMTLLVWSVTENMVRISAGLKFRSTKTNAGIENALRNHDQEYLIWLQNYLSDNPEPTSYLLESHRKYFMDNLKLLIS